MNNIVVRKMMLNDQFDLKKNVYPNMPLEMIENNVKNNVKAMDEGSNWVYFVATIDNEVVGTMYLEIGVNSLNKHIGELFSVVTGEAFQGRGVCKALLSETIKYALSKNLEKIILTVRGGTKAETVYQKLGFTKYGELPNGLKELDKYYNKVYYYIEIKE